MYHPQIEYYHVHSNATNIFTIPDSTIFIKDYAKVFRERGMQTLCMSEHGNRSDVWEQFDITEGFKAEGYHMTPIAACEAYFVPDRHKEDKRNFHLVLVAKNMEGFYELNDCLSEANISGFYGKARVDLELLSNLNPRNFMATTACVGGIFGLDDASESTRLVMQLKEIFRDNLFLEVQHHNFDTQKCVNARILEVYRKYKLPLIYGTDSHYITHEDASLRKELIASTGRTLNYEDEFDLFLPTAQEAYDLLLMQNVLSRSQIEEAMENTLQLRTFEGVSFTRERKMPNCKPEMTLKQRNNLFKKLVCDGFIERAGMPTKEEAAEIHAELDTITETDSADYFIAHKYLIDKGLEYGGILTQTSRGSAASFVTNFALGLTTINRLRCPVTMYPDRFISKDRLAAGSNPDIDLNMANVEAFERAGKELFGEYGCSPMIAYGTTKTLSAFKLLARARNIDATLANDVSNQIKKYELDVKHAKENNADDPDYDVNDEIHIEDYVLPEYIPLIKDSAQYLNIRLNVSPHPCAHLLTDRNTRREIGIISLKPRPGCEERNLCAYIDGATADAYGYLKADFLRVDVVKIIADAFKYAGVPMLSSTELLEKIKDDKEVWDLYANGFTMGLNQCEREKSTEKCMRYKPKNIVELSGFIAGIRPGFASQLETFLSRKPNSFGIKALDGILQSPSRPDSFIEFDEDIMHIAQYAGISGPDSYALIKAVKKKKAEKVKHYQEQLISGFTTRMTEQGMEETEATQTAEEIWKIVEGSASYLFNLAHAFAMAIDSAYGAYLKVHYPYEFYLSMLKLYDNKGNKEKIVSIIQEMKRYKGIKMLPGRLGQDNTDWTFNREDATISQSLSSVKYISKTAAQELSEMAALSFNTFTDCLFHIQRNTHIDTRQRKVLIGIGYFFQFGSAPKLLKVAEEFDSGKYRISKQLKSYNLRLPELRKIEASLPEEPETELRVSQEFENMGLCIFKDDKAPANLYYVQSVDDKYTVNVILYSVQRGTFGKLKITKAIYQQNRLSQGDFISLINYTRKKKFIYSSGKRIPTKEFENWLTEYSVKEK